MKIAMLQMPVGFDKEENIRKARSAVRWAAEQGAEMAILPEMWNCPYSNQYFPQYAEEGIGPTRAKALLRQFGSLKGVQNATVEELLLVKGMTRPAAEAIERYFQSKG